MRTDFDTAARNVCTIIRNTQLVDSLALFMSFEMGVKTYASLGATYSVSAAKDSTPSHPIAILTYHHDSCVNDGFTTAIWMEGNTPYWEN